MNHQRVLRGSLAIPMRHHLTTVPLNLLPPYGCRDGPVSRWLCFSQCDLKNPATSYGALSRPHFSLCLRLCTLVKLRASSVPSIACSLRRGPAPFKGSIYRERPLYVCSWPSCLRARPMSTSLIMKGPCTLLPSVLSTSGVELMHLPRGRCERYKRGQRDGGVSRDPSQYRANSLATCSYVFPLVSGTRVSVNQPKKAVSATKMR